MQATSLGNHNRGSPNVLHEQSMQVARTNSKPVRQCVYRGIVKHTVFNQS